MGPHATFDFDNKRVSILIPERDLGRRRNLTRICKSFLSFLLAANGGFITGVGTNGGFL